MNTVAIPRFALTAAVLGAAWTGLHASAQDVEDEPIRPTRTTEYGGFSHAFDEYTTVLVPDRDEAEWWAGAPSAVRTDEGVFWMAARMRSPESPRGLRGYELRILRSEDGVTFDTVHALRREDVPIPGFERPALLIDPVTGMFKLYACGPWEGGPWVILKFDDAPSPAEFRPETARPVIAAPPKTYERDIAPHEYKDPVIIHANGAYHAYVIGVMRRTERIFHFTSADGEDWETVGSRYTPVMTLTGWHDFYVRPASVVPVGPGYLFVYEGSNARWYDPVYNIVTGLAYTFDLHHIIDLTPEAPLVMSSTPGPRFATWRYSSWVPAGDEWFIYAEVARPNESFETRLFRLPRP